MSVFADILVLAALIAAAWLGARRGLLKSLGGLLIVVVALLGASWAADHLSEPVARGSGAPGDPAGGTEN